MSLYTFDCKKHGITHQEAWVSASYNIIWFYLLYELGTADYLLQENVVNLWGKFYLSYWP